MKTSVRWTDQDLRVLRDNFSTATKTELFDLLKGRHTTRGIVNRAWREGLVKSEEHRARVGVMNNRWAKTGSSLAVPRVEKAGPVLRMKPGAGKRERLELRQG